MMNFKTIRKVGLSALLAGTFVFSAEDSSAAPAYKEPAGTTMTARQADRKMKSTFAEQEKQLTAEQKKLWETIKNHKDFSQILPEIKMNLDITKITKNTNYIFVPYDGDNRYVWNYKDYKSITLYWRSPSDPINVVYNHGQIARDYQTMFVVPSYDVPDFVKDKAECYFYTSKTELEKLSASEKEYVQALDKCLNENYHFLYGKGFADMDETQLAEGKLAGHLYPLFRLSKREEKGFAPVKFGNTPLEIKIHRHIGAPMSLEDIAKTSGFGYFGGCEGETHFMTNQTEGIFGVPWAKDISKDKKLISLTYAQANVRQKQGVLASIKILEEGMEGLIAEGIPGASQEFTNLLQAKEKQVLKYNSLLEKYVRLSRNGKLPKSLAHTHALDKYLTDNFEKKAHDGIEPVKITNQNVSAGVAVQKKNYELQR